MQEVPLSSPPWPIDTSSMSTSSNLLLALLLVQCILYGYLLLLDSLRPPPSATVTPSSTVSQLDRTDATSEQWEATSSEASAPDEDAEDQLIEPGHAFLDKMAQLVPTTTTMTRRRHPPDNLAGACQAPPS